VVIKVLLVQKESRVLVDHKVVVDQLESRVIKVILPKDPKEFQEKL
jgi:hypothetical protein